MEQLECLEMRGDYAQVLSAQALVWKVTTITGGPTVYFPLPQKSRRGEGAQRLGLWAPREVGDGNDIPWCAIGRGCCVRDFRRALGSDL